MSEKELTRRTMYELVWSKPITKIADELGISNVALKKICAKHRVPTPPRGYWAKKQAGKPVTQMPFQEAADGSEAKIVIRAIQSGLPDGVKQFLHDERERRKARLGSRDRSISAASNPLREVHAAVAMTAKALREAKPDGHGVVAATGEGLCGLSIGKASIERAIGILDQLARRLEERGLSLTAAGKAMKVAAGSDAAELSLTEKAEMRKHVPTAKELAQEKQRLKMRERNRMLGIYDYGERSFPEFDWVRTGMLSLEISDQWFPGLRRSWRDGKIQRVENVLDDVVGGIAAYLAALKARREENERREREWEREKRRRALVQARLEREGKRRQFVDRYVALSNEARNLAAFRETVSSMRPDREADDLSRMIQWVEQKLAEFDAQITPDGINRALREQRLFPESDELGGEDIEE